jgi:F0F1-type ATP synthase alpha subunit
MLTPKFWITVASRNSSSPQFAFLSSQSRYFVGPACHTRNNTMNIKRYASIASLVIGSSSAWTSSNLHHYPNGIDSSFKRGIQKHFEPTASGGRQASTLLHQSAIVEEMDTTNQEEDSLTPSSPEIAGRGQPVARGSILNVFRGGLVAVRVDDDLLKAYQGGSITPKVDDTTQTLPSTLTSTSSFNSLGKRSVAVATELTHFLFSLCESRSHPFLFVRWFYFMFSSGGDLIGRQVVFDNDGTTGVVVVHRPPVIYVYTDEMKENTKTSQPSDTLEGTVTVLDNLFTIHVPDDALRVDCFGKSETTDRSGSTKLLSRPIFSPIPQVKDIKLINKPLVTGVTMFDALAPIGKGQNMLLVGHDIQDMRRYVCDMLTIQAKKDTDVSATSSAKCIYAATGGKHEQDQVRSLLEGAGVLGDVVLVTMNGDKNDSDEASDAAEATVVAATACAIAESLALEGGMDTFVVVDTINQHKKLWDVTTRVLVDVFGVDAVVKGDRDGGASSEMRAFFSSLIQRSAHYKQSRGGGSVTLLLLQTIPRIHGGNTENMIFSPDDFNGSPDKVKERISLLVQKNIPLSAATLRKIQIPIPSVEEGMRRLALQHVDDLISMSDGQIWFDERLEESGRRPPMDFQRSVTRIGIGADTESRADAPAMRRVVEGLRLDLSQAESMDGAEIETTASQRQMRNTQAWLLAMHQPSASGARKLSESCVAMLAASTGCLNDSIDRGVKAGSEDGEMLIRNLLQHVNSVVPEAMRDIDTTLDFSQETKDVVQRAIQSFFEQ